MSTRSLGGRLLPALRWLPRLDRSGVRADVIAGLTGAIIVLPQGVAYALIAGLPPQYGLYSAIVPPIVAALYGSSLHSVTGPTAANSILVLAMVSAVAPPGSDAFVPLALTLSFLVGAVQLGMGLLRFGMLVNFISDTVVVGFTAGAAVLIAASQLRHFFGLAIPDDSSFLRTIIVFFREAHAMNRYSVGIAIATLLITLGVRRFRPRWPSMIVGMLAGSLAAAALRVHEHGVHFVGALPGTLPEPSAPALSLETVSRLAPGALAIALVGLVQAISSARAVAVRSGQQIDSNQEFIGQGLANLVGSFFSSYPCSGSFTRSGANYDAGARTPLAAIIAAGILAVILVTVPGLTAYLPMPAMAGIVMLIAWNLVDFTHIARIVRVSRRETAILLVTFLATLFLALEFAIYVGVLLSLALYLRRTARPRMVPVAPVPDRPERSLRNADKRGLAECPRLRIFRIDGSIFFGAVDHVQRVLRRAQEEYGYRHVLLVGGGVNFIDVAGAGMLQREALRLRAGGGGLYLCSFKDPAMELLHKEPYVSAIGRDRFYASPQDAIAGVFSELAAEPCADCDRAVFMECALIECGKRARPPATG